MKYVGATVEGFTEYHEARGREIPATWDDETIEASLLVASEWIDNVYGNIFVGWKTGGFLQDNQWPRSDAIVESGAGWYTIPNDTVPAQVINAVYEAAFRNSTSPGSLQMDYTPGKYKRVSIDGALSVEYAGFNFASDIQSTFPVIDQILSPLFDPRGAGNFSILSGDIERV